MSDMSNWQNFEHWIHMSSREEREEALTDLLSGIAEVWLDTPEDPLVRGLISTTRSIIDGINEYAEALEAQDDDERKHANQYVMGVYVHALRQVMSNFQALIGLTDVKKSLS
jgi:hypothetical protein